MSSKKNDLKIRSEVGENNLKIRSKVGKRRKSGREGRLESGDE